jgi:hypothetical protein
MTNDAPAHWTVSAGHDGLWDVRGRGARYTYYHAADERDARRMAALLETIAPHGLPTDDYPHLNAE